MHSFGYRANALFTFAITILAFICAIASFTDTLNSPTPTVEVKVLNIIWFQKQPNGNDEVSLTLNISTDLQTLFTWNTKQVFIFLTAEYETRKHSLNQISLWDGIIQSKEHSKFTLTTISLNIKPQPSIMFPPGPPVSQAAEAKSYRHIGQASTELDLNLSQPPPQSEPPNTPSVYNLSLITVFPSVITPIHTGEPPKHIIRSNSLWISPLTILQNFTSDPNTHHCVSILTIISPSCFLSHNNRYSTHSPP